MDNEKRAAAQGRRLVDMLAAYPSQLCMSAVPGASLGAP